MRQGKGVPSYAKASEGILTLFERRMAEAGGLEPPLPDQQFWKKVGKAGKSRSWLAKSAPTDVITNAYNRQGRASVEAMLCRLLPHAALLSRIISR
jgi:hypothetical protein